MKKLISLILVLAICCTFLPQLPIVADATSITDPTLVDGADYTNIYATKLDNILKGKVCLFSNSTSLFPVGSSLNTSTSYKVAGAISGKQCYIYAQAVYYYLFGDIPYSGGGYKYWSDSKKVISNKSEFSYTLFKDAKVGFGAYIRTTGNSDGSYNGNVGHSMIVLAYNNSNITYLDCNADGKGLVQVQTRTWSNFNQVELTKKGRKICHVVQCVSAMNDHSYIDTSTNTGICEKCDHVFNWKSTFNPADAGIYKLTSPSYIPRTEPYTNSAKVNFCIANPNSVQVLGSYTNAYGSDHKWFVLGSLDDPYFVYYERMDLIKYDAPNVTCTGFAPANNAKIPKATYNITGTVKSNNYPIQKIVAYLDGSSYATWTAPINTTMSLNLKSTVINTNLKFSSLAVGKHTIELVAYGYNGSNTHFHSSVFYIENTACTHSYTSMITTAPTCATNGVRTYTCSKCSASYTESIAATGHTYSYKVTKAPTTSATGTLTGTCSKCSGTTSVTLPKLNTTDYSYAVMTAATCKATGTGRYTWKTTTYGSFYFDVTIAKTSHSYGTASCTKPATCSVCGATSGSALGHTYSYKVTKAPTTSATGTLTGTCSKCSGTTTVTLPKLNTTDYSYAVRTAATCKATGTGRYTWKTTTYGSFNFDVTIAKTSHSYSTASCTKPATCSVCGATSGSALGHSYSNGSCTVCGAKDPNHVVDQNAPMIVVDTVSGRAEETVTVTVSMKNNPGFGGMAYDIVYDSAILELVSYETGLGNTICTDSGVGTYANKVNFQYAGTSNVTGDGVLVTLTFKIKASAPEGTALISVVPEEGTFFTYEGRNENDFSANCVNGGVKVVKYISGDINGDGKVNNRDAARLLQKLAGWDVACVEATQDVNGDGKVNNRDAARILQYLAGWDVQLH